MRAYKASEYNRFTSHLPSQSMCRPTQAELASGALATIRARSRYIVKNHPHATGAVNMISRRVAGGGLRIQARLRGNDNAYLRDENYELEWLWQEFSRAGISTTGDGQHAFLNLALRTRLIDGEVFFIKVIDAQKAPITRSWQIVRGDQLAEDIDFLEPSTGNKVIAGIEIDRYGKPIAYHIYDDGFSSYAMIQNRNRVRIPADRVIHWFRREYPDQLRGIPLLAPVILPLADLDEFRTAELVKAWSQACYVGFVKTPFMSENIETRIDADASYDQPQEVMEPGTISRLAPGEEIDFGNPSSPGGQFDPFTISILRSIATGLGLSYEAFNRDYSRSNYSSARAGALEDKLTFKDLALEMDEQFVSPIWRDFIDHVYSINQLRSIPQTLDLYEHWITHPQPGHIDPLKEATALKSLIESRLMSRREACAERGRDFFEIVDELAEENEYMQSKGITPEQVDQAVLQQTIDQILSEGDQ